MDEGLEAALLAYKQRKAARWGAERFAAEFRRRDEAEVKHPVWSSDALTPPVEASVESQVVEGEPATFRQEPPRVGFDETFLVPDPVALRSAPIVPDPVTVESPPVLQEAVAFEADRFEPEEITVEATWPVPEVVVEPEPEHEPEPEPEPELVQPPVRHPHVPRPPAPVLERTPEPRRRAWRGKRGEPETVRPSVITAPEWARMSPGARRLYGLEEPPATRAG